MDRQQALHAAINGHKVTHSSYPKGNYLFFDRSVSQFRAYQELGGYATARDIFQYENGYGIMKEEKTIVRFVNIYQNKRSTIHDNIDIADDQKEFGVDVGLVSKRVACKEIEIKYYEGEGLE